MTDSRSYDAIIVGTGQAGKPLAKSLARSGRKTAIIERDERVGGSCVVYGCTPTKTMVASARVAHLARRAGEYGVQTGPIEIELERVRERKRAIVDMFSGGSRKGLEREELVDLIFGEAKFLGRDRVAVGELELTAPLIFINTGTKPSVPDIDGLADVPYLTSNNVTELASVPEHLVILGGGYVGIEFGQMFRRFGSAVTIVQRGRQLLPREDADVAEAIQDIFREDGIELMLGAAVTGVARDGEGATSITVERAGETVVLEASELLVAAGRSPNTGALSPKAAGVDVDRRGFIPVNARLETNVEGIYALGDVNGGPAFTHISYDDYRIVETNLLGDGGASTDGRLVPYAVFMDPELGRVGLSEGEARERGIAFEVAKIPMTHVARALEADETRGFMKALVDPETEQILGCAVLGVGGGEVMSVIQVAMMGRLPYTSIRNGVFAHPTMSESLNNLFMQLKPRKSV